MLLLGTAGVLGLWAALSIGLGLWIALGGGSRFYASFGLLLLLCAVLLVWESSWVWAVQAVGLLTAVGWPVWEAGSDLARISDYGLVPVAVGALLLMPDYARRLQPGKSATTLRPAFGDTAFSARAGRLALSAALLLYVGLAMFAA